MQRIKNAIYYLVSKAAILSSSPVQKNTLLLVKTDEIGDYVLWRNVLPCIRRSARYKDHKITLLGNIAWKELALHFDAPHANEFIWIDKKKFKSDMRYRYNFLKQVRSAGFEKLVNCIFSRSPRTDDAIVSVCSEAHKTGMMRNDHNVAAFEKGYDRGLYQEIHELPLTGLFEFDRNKAFASAFLQEPCDPVFGFDPASLPSSPVVATNYAVIFPGSGRSDRRWPPAYFAEIAKYLHKEKGLEIVLAGGPGDREASVAVSSMLDFKVKDITATTTLTQFTGLLSKARLLVSVDTGAVHLAAAAGCPVYGLFTGDQYGRFAPYPAGLTKQPFYAIYPDEFEKELSSQPDIREKYQYFSGFGLNSIKPEKVISKLSKL